MSTPLQTNLTSSPGKYRKNTPVVGSRAEELQLIYKYKHIFKEYQRVIYGEQKLNIIPINVKNKADEISKEIYAEYIKKYSDHGVTIENSVDWADMDLTKTYLSDLENEFNTWNVQAFVAKPNHNSHIKNQLYRPAYICALHELMHVEETPLGILEHQYTEFSSVDEVLTVTRTLILMDEVYKKTLNLPIDVEADYENSFSLFGKSIKQGEFANFYRKLEKGYPSLAEALVSNESLVFLGQTKKLTSASMQSNIEVAPNSSINNISMMVLGGFITVLGLAAVTTSFILLNALTGGVVGLVVAGIGIASTLSGIGLFAIGAYRNTQPKMSCETLGSLAV
jgi:hypothetical protein